MGEVLDEMDRSRGFWSAARIATLLGPRLRLGTGCLAGSACSSASAGVALVQSRRAGRACKTVQSQALPGTEVSVFLLDLDRLHFRRLLVLDIDDDSSVVLVLL